ncbi:oxalurate catabolism protein HpxX [Klebsiella quasipneumoniae]|uniref:oxalurate catabolism protein HpxX n=1 Tax=Klebsiella quasipneumoniae TaxID=1463165 RepID=UPI000B415D31|nr:oxalurate catabolism protein HpxX [Klebsiella quasipneumoniae]MDJ1029882.1 oxalurate catabolism protein HpxX [Klebsiella quasipneumoniae]RNT43445.1 oxalurate catabolism protein HpxX [Klebsiella quasipneumoniae subsp. quasipneumoniae]HBQ3014780.1 oxalurate catabolism protein HpxX [Klebsiella quasipneumoniae subsp. quasipneumoniae]HBW1842680.1 oxalurate catabolism protein HpxX [Klebsiella quasipneumoniae subsp. quasipneumoniae]HCI6931822.1 oxalurate catabolism protein HpxX [Klebsiella quasipn
MTTQPDWSEYLTQMTHLLRLELDAPRREELERQFARIAAMAKPLMDYPLGPRDDIAGVYKA